MNRCFPFIKRELKENSSISICHHSVKNSKCWTVMDPEIWEQHMLLWTGKK